MKKEIKENKRVLNEEEIQNLYNDYSRYLNKKDNLVSNKRKNFNILANRVLNKAKKLTDIMKKYNES